MRGRQADSGDGFIREVDEAVRQDRWMRLWKHYGPYLIGAAVAIVLGTGAGVAWRHYQESQRQAEAERYAAADELLRQERAAEAAAAFRALAEEADGGYPVVARLRAAEAESMAGQSEAAAATLTALADSDAAAPVFRELGNLLVLQRAVDDADPSALGERLAGLTAANSPWRHSALELEALAQLRAGDLAAARRTLDGLLADPQTPANLSRRAAELLASLGGPEARAGGAAAPDDGLAEDPAAAGGAAVAGEDPAEETQ